MSVVVGPQSFRCYICPNSFSGVWNKQGKELADAESLEQEQQEIGEEAEEEEGSEIAGGKKEEEVEAEEEEEQPKVTVRLPRPHAFWCSSVDAVQSSSYLTHNASDPKIKQITDGEETPNLPRNWETRCH